MNIFLIQCVVLVVGLVGCLFLFVSLKSEFLKYTQRDQADRDELRKLLDVTKRDVKRSDVAQSVGLPPAPDQLDQKPGEAQQSLVPAVRSGFNLNRRVHALRLLRRGEDVAHVAAALGVPRKEVELLVRVQDLTTKSVGTDDAHPPAE